MVVPFTFTLSREKNCANPCLPAMFSLKYARVTGSCIKALENPSSILSFHKFKKENSQHNVRIQKNKRVYNKIYEYTICPVEFVTRKRKSNRAKSNNLWFVCSLCDIFKLWYLALQKIHSELFHQLLKWRVRQTWIPNFAN